MVCAYPLLHVLRAFETVAVYSRRSYAHADIGLWSYGSILFFYSLFWLIVSEFLILGGGGDFIIVLKILLHRSKGKDTLYYDHPYECGVVVFEK